MVGKSACSLQKTHLAHLFIYFDLRCRHNSRSSSCVPSFPKSVFCQFDTFGKSVELCQVIQKVFPGFYLLLEASGTRSL